jgi:hypothetical protein
MVSHFVGHFEAAARSTALGLAAAEGKGKLLFERLDPPSRAKVMMALLALVLVGVTLVLATVVAGRYLRRIARHTRGKTPTRHDDWYRKPLIPPERKPPTAGDPE